MEATQIKPHIRAFGEFRSDSIDVENRTVEFVISNEARDRDGTVISIAGWRLENYQLNPIVCYQHDTGTRWNSSPDPDVVIGHCIEIRIEDDLLIGVVKFDREEEERNPLAEKVFRKVQRGTLRATSVGFWPHDGHWGDIEDGEDSGTYYFTDQELMEFSIVALPSNPKAIARSYEGDIDSFKQQSKSIESEETQAEASTKEKVKRTRNHGVRLRLLNIQKFRPWKNN